MREDDTEIEPETETESEASAEGEAEADSRRPIERTFPIEQVNEIAEREAHAKRYYRPVYTMHKWWARRLGSVFRTIVLYALADDELRVEGYRQTTLDGSDGLPEIDWMNPDALWEYYLEDVDLGEKTVLDPFMGGGTSIVESLRLGCNAAGSELNPVAWFIVKKEVEPVDLDALDAAYDRLESTVGEEIQEYYRTKCPDCDGDGTGECVDSDGTAYADAVYNFWLKKLPCQECGEGVPLLKEYRLADARSSTDEYAHVVCPDCWHVFETEDAASSTDCPACDHTFVPNEAGHVSGETYDCPHCGAEEMNVIESVDRYGPPEQDLFAVEYYCHETGECGYKAAEAFDRELAREAEQEFEALGSALPIPTQTRYRGSSDRAWNHGYERYADMFNDRQLLCLGKLLREIDRIEDQNVKEFLLLAFSDALAFNNLFCEYHTSENKIQGIYKRHTITARHQPVENNVWGTERGAGAFSNAFRKMRAGKKYCQHPYEKYVEDGETKQKDGIGEIVGQLVDDPAALGEDGNVFLRCGSSEELPLADDSVDAVVTDPPYFDNVMYAETADFYYVWLRQVLADEYDHFEPDLTPKATEIVSDPAGEDTVDVYRDEDHFTKGLTNVFRESNRVLDDDGVMAFTFHHTETEGWSTLLRAILEAGFAVSALYPIRGEMQGSTHIHDKDSIEYDVIVVCRNREDDPEDVRWETLEAEITDRARETVERLEDDGARLTHGDIFAVAMGTSLEVFSRHYPNVRRDGEPVTVEDALDAIRDVVDEQLLAERIATLRDELDPVSAVYLTCVCGRGETIAVESLRTALRQHDVDVSVLVDAGLVERDGDRVRVLDPLDRTERIETKDEPLAIDRAHYLYALDSTGRLAGAIDAWADDRAIRALRRLATIEDEDAYAAVADYVEERSAGQRGISEFG